MSPWLTYALLLACALLFGFGFWVSSERRAPRFPRLARFSIVMQIGAVVAGYLVVRPGTGDDGVVDLAAASADGRPIFVDLYSNF